MRAALLNLLLCSQMRSLAAIEVRGDPPQEPVRKIAYIKLHATGSGILNGILHRYCSNHDLKCFGRPMPEEPGSTATREDLKSDLVHLQELNESVDIWSSHANFEPDIFDQIIPGSVKISLLRDPWERILSHYTDSGKKQLKTMATSLLKNQKLVDACGPDGSKMSDSIPIPRLPLLDFVLLSEQYHRSLIMMRRRFGWSRDDLMYLKKRGTVKQSMENILVPLKKYLSLPEGQMSIVARNFLHECILDAETILYKWAHEAFGMQWKSFTQSEQQDIDKEEEEYDTALDKVADCCAANPSDGYCKFLSDDSPEEVPDKRPGKETTCSALAFKASPEEVAAEAQPTPQGEAPGAEAQPTPQEELPVAQPIPHKKLPQAKVAASAQPLAAQVQGLPKNVGAVFG